MANKAIGIRLYLDGAKEFNNDIKNANASLKQFQSELKQNQEAFKGSENSMEPLQSLSETIAREIVAPVVTYGATKTIENVSKYNDWLEQYLTSKTAEKTGSGEE